MNVKMNSKRGRVWAVLVLGIGGILALIALIALVMSISVTDASETCAITLLGNVTGHTRTGFQLIHPLAGKSCYPLTANLLQTGSEENKRADFWDYPVEIKSQDGQSGTATFNLLWHVDPQCANGQGVEYIRRSVAQSNKDLIERVVLNKARSVPRDLAAKYSAEGLYSIDRERYAADVFRQLVLEYRSSCVVVQSFDLRDINWSPEYEAAIEQKQIAQQGIQTADFVAQQKEKEAEQARQIAQGEADASVIRTKAEAENTVLKARAEADSLALVAEALQKNPLILEYEKIKRLSPALRLWMVPNNQNYLLPTPDAGE